MKIKTGDQVQVFDWNWTVISVRDIEDGYFEAERFDPFEGVVRGYFNAEQIEVQA